jgi:hypothetical protein
LATTSFSSFFRMLHSSECFILPNKGIEDRHSSQKPEIS